MIVYSTLKRENLGRSCRKCINKTYNLKLEPVDCVYLPYQHTCMVCREHKNIVADIVLLKRYKLLSGTEASE